LARRHGHNNSIIIIAYRHVAGHVFDVDPRLVGDTVWERTTQVRLQEALVYPALER